MMKKAARFMALPLVLLAAACGGDDPQTTGSGGSGATSSSSSSTGSGGSGGGGGGTGGYEFTVVKGFTAPESCFWDATNKVWYVSNMAPPMSGDLLTPDGEGWISKLAINGTTVDLTEKWVTGFDTPAGLRMHDGILYVANITKAHGIDVKTGTVVENYVFPAAKLLNDPAVDAAGNVYITDTFGNAVYTFKAGMMGSEAEFLSSPELMGPNGALVVGEDLLVASLVDFDPMNLGPFLRINLASKAITPIPGVMGKWDGLELDGTSFLLSDNPSGKIISVNGQDGAQTVLVDLGKDEMFKPAADFGWDPETRTLCVPNLADSVAIVKLP